MEQEELTQLKKRKQLEEFMEDLNELFGQWITDSKIPLSELIRSADLFIDTLTKELNIHTVKCINCGKEVKKAGLKVLNGVGVAWKGIKYLCNNPEPVLTVNVLGNFLMTSS